MQITFTTNVETTMLAVLLHARITMQNTTLESPSNDHDDRLRQ